MISSIFFNQILVWRKYHQVITIVFQLGMRSHIESRYVEVYAAYTTTKLSGGNTALLQKNSSYSMIT